MAAKNLSKRESTLVSLVPLFVLVSLLALCVYFFGSDSLLGASQVALLVASGVCIWLGIWIYGLTWENFEEGVGTNIKEISSPIFILIMVGAISGTWMMSGIIPTFIYYGIQIISPRFFLPTACILCAIVSIMTGSSWTTIATVGVALLGIGRAEGINNLISVGAIISGAYFGDKMSPLSDTTVLAASVAGTSLFDHIKYMMGTTVPSVLISLTLFTIIGLSHKGATPDEISIFTETLKGSFNLTPWLLIVPLVTAYLIYKKKPALMVLALSAGLAAIFGIVFQSEVFLTIARDGMEIGSKAFALVIGAIRVIYDSVSYDTGVEQVNELIASKGMLGMLNTVFLIICAMCFGGCMKASGMIRRVTDILIPMTRTRVGLVGATVLTGTFLNGIVSDQFLSIILTSDIYKDIYKREGYNPRLLSRSVEDSATVTSPLCPWSTCGMTQATILGVPTLMYAPFCFFCWISPLMSFLVAILGYKIVQNKPR